MSKVLVDSNIFLDYYLDRKDNLLPLGEFAFQFFKAATDCKHFVFITKDVLFEVRSILGFSEEEVWQKVFGPLKKKNKIRLVEYGKVVEQNAILLAKEWKIPKTDASLIEVAKANNFVLVSRNFHFESAKGIVNVCKPEELG